ncbi:LacI family DNA-binding transcriptional regulator [Pontivivens ytuae]|uniref:Substrate-binding domain-containing protein n=1 Tax=Pontivivens ytuae TaxID=2789856 RepID=A0A7S9QC62_9RHOB|nr:substrate-binding domain-containing protein [Pontivivens ytuae]QPH52761.1 substrate-binding domain-containing protein [Pontivivens ytuae]
MATLKDIGAELGLSVATVSRALNGFPEVSLKTRTKVQETADRLGYRPNRVAQRLVTGRSGMVGMVVKIKPDMSADQTFFEMLTGLTAALSARETDLVLAVDQGGDPVLPYRKLLERGILDGFILNAPVTDDPRVTFLREQGIPFVLHGRDRATPDYPNFGIDNAAVSATSVDMLAHLGHRRIALINGELRHAYAAERLEGFRAAMARHDLAPDSARNGATFESHAYTRALELLAQADAPTAFVCASTVIAAGVMRAVRDRGLSVPGDVSVMAHDDALPLTRAISFDPALTVTRAPLRDACEPLANMLVDHLGGVPAEALQVMMDVELIVRGSTGPAPKGG